MKTDAGLAAGTRPVRLYYGIQSPVVLVDFHHHAASVFLTTNGYEL
jgi:hypothetical protein